MTTSSSRMNAGERQALRQVVRQRMKVLRNDVAARKAELEAEIEEQVTKRFAARDKLLQDTNERVFAITDQANKDIRALLEQVQSDHDVKLQLGHWLPELHVAIADYDKRSMRTRLHKEVAAQVAAALVNIDRREADLIEELTVDGLTTEAAKNFLNRIPTVGQLVPADRLKEITG